MIERTDNTCLLLTYAQYGDPSVLEVTNTPEPHAGPGQVRSLVDEGKFVVRIDSVFPLSDAAKAHERSEAGHLSGKIVLTVPEA